MKFLQYEEWMDAEVWGAINKILFMFEERRLGVRKEARSSSPPLQRQEEEQCR